MSREREALEAAIAAARSVGFDADRGRVVSISTHTTVSLEPCSVIARVILAPEGWQQARCAREVSVAAALASAGAPAGRPAIERPISASRSIVTLWDVLEPIGEPQAVPAAFALAACHRALLGFVGSLPSWTDALDDAQRLASASPLSGCHEADRMFLSQRADELRSRIEVGGLTSAPIHGDAHLGNVLHTSHGPMWIDWESACLGPLEWDIASMPAEASAAWPRHDHELLAMMRSLRHACVAIWCFARSDSSPAIRDVARFHLDQLRQG